MNNSIRPNTGGGCCEHASSALELQHLGHPKIEIDHRKWTGLERRRQFESAASGLLMFESEWELADSAPIAGELSRN